MDYSSSNDYSSGIDYKAEGYSSSNGFSRNTNCGGSCPICTNCRG